MCTCFIKGRSQPTNVSSALSLRVTVKDISFTHQHSRYSDSLYLQRIGILYFGIIRFAFGIFSYVPDFVQAKAYMGHKKCAIKKDNYLKSNRCTQLLGKRSNDI